MGETVTRNMYSKAIAENKNAIVASCWTYFTTMQLPLIVFQKGTQPRGPDRRPKGDKKQIPHKGPKKLHTKVQILVATGTWRPGFVHSCSK